MQTIIRKYVCIGLSCLLLAACARSNYGSNGAGSATGTGLNGMPVGIQDTAIARPAMPQAGKVRPAGGTQTPSVQVPDAER